MVPSDVAPVPSIDGAAGRTPDSGQERRPEELHDVLFAPFFAGSAGTGQIWHWNTYVERHELDINVILGDASVARNWQIYAFPSYYVLDSSQRIVRRDIGYSSQLGLLWRAWSVD